MDQLFDTEGFNARWTCGSGWTQPHGWTHIVSDYAIFMAYFAIPCVLLYFISKRRDVPFAPVLVLFAVFILSCGLTHAMDATLFWWPAYRLSAAIKVVTAIASWGTVIALGFYLPRLLGLPGLRTVNEQLMREIEERKRAELAMQDKVRDLEQFSRVTVDREKQMINLKREVNRLAEKLGESAPYDLSGLGTDD